ncbi:MAG: hypothetical protein EA402_04930 [Planctomycetota bacterium]|nr:MAG: hypothetical protein EA402_04930 [Planctomycetota bacterium]
MSLIAEADEDRYEPSEPEPSLSPDSPISFEEREEGLAILVPARGLLRGSRGLFVMALGWLAVTLPSSLVVIISLVSERRGEAASAGIDEIMVSLLFALVFVGAGVAMLLIAISMGRRSYQILLAADGLTLRTIGWRRQRTDHLSLEDLDQISVGHSGMTVNNKRIMEVQAFAAGNQRKALGMLTTCSDEDVDWAAWKLEQTRRRLRGEDYSADSSAGSTSPSNGRLVENPE